MVNPPRRAICYGSRVRLLWFVAVFSCAPQPEELPAPSKVTVEEARARMLTAWSENTAALCACGEDRACHNRVVGRFVGWQDVRGGATQYERDEEVVARAPADYAFRKKLSALMVEARRCLPYPYRPSKTNAR